ncbi:hypothetical protein L1987_57477 [Smallanthus sonchifolius]|uniref:Uncharacterized protein n=1 Tax=Smallanthus sonchifolius TaxID=185202 RepID=A0ACB9DCT7_9ASTR|nr:hypothetical protein L1987_57477 [Smallanthus sonchifolius]
MSGLLLAVFGLFAVIAIGSLLVTNLELRHLIIGFLSCATLISMFASPLSITNGIGTILGRPRRMFRKDNNQSYGVSASCIGTSAGRTAEIVVNGSIGFLHPTGKEGAPCGSFNRCSYQKPV